MKKIQIHTAQKNYEIIVGALPEIAFEGKILIVTNPKICALHIEKLLRKIRCQSVFVCTIKDGEEHKNLATIEEILSHAFNHKLDRKSLMIALGGGVVSDMVGFAAGIYQRGIDFINIPTTLLAQVDASVGGKTGVNNAFGKNLVGLFHQPRAVHIDTALLKTLPKREFAAGVAEIIKIAATFDAEFFAWLEGANLEREADLTHAIARSVELKAQVVSEDSREEGIRAGLNYGHTFGHIIELLGGYTRHLHGEAVALGMVMANNLAQSLGKLSAEEAARVENLLARFGLPTRFTVADCEGFYAHFYLDKKSHNDRLRFVIPKGIGKMEIVENPPKNAVLAALRGEVLKGGGESCGEFSGESRAESLDESKRESRGESSPCNPTTTGAGH